MTETQLREKVASTAIKYLGYKESNGSHKKIIDIYNNHKPLAQNYRVKYTDAWCATYTSAISILCGLTDIMPTECSCPRMIELYKKLGRWKEADGYKPSVGDIVMYDWQDNGKGDNTGTADHVGIVTKVSGDTITVIEGNMDNAVGYRTLKVNGRYIRGYCLPDYASKATSSPSSTTNSSVSNLNKNIKWNGYVVANELNVRTWAGTNNPKCSFSPLKKNAVVGVCDSVKDKDGLIWYYIKYDNKYGFVSSKYVKSSLSSTPLTVGAKLKLSKVALYTSATVVKKSDTKTGDYYIWDTTIINNRIRITNNTANVGKSGKITGWINVEDAKSALT